MQRTDPGILSARGSCCTMLKRSNGVADVRRYPTQPSVWIWRAVYLSLFFWILAKRQELQTVVDLVWRYLRTTWIFNSVYFETWWVTANYAIILAWPFAFSKIAFFKRYQIDPALRWHDAGLKAIFVEMVVYCAPLMTLDTFTVKKYHGADESELAAAKTFWIQRRRILPPDPPTVLQVIWHLAVSFLLYDAIFYVVHLTLHKNVWLYKHVHASHHEHSTTLHSRITNRLTVVERVVLVLSANQALKIVRAHPLTRAIFVPLFVGWLVENHSGYDLPWTLDKVVPFGLVGGSRYHYDHHMKGSKKYQPFFTYIDKLVAIKSKRN